MYMNRKKIIDGFNSIEGLGEEINIGVTKKDSIEELLTLNMTFLKEHPCKTTGNTSIFLVVLILSTLVLTLVIVGIVVVKKKWPMKSTTSEILERNPEYSTNYDDAVCEFRDNTDYYFEHDPGDIAQISDKNEYYYYTS